MSPDEIRALIGGYATGSLTEAERKILFDAALEDQELFDQLAGEQALKETIETPGARARLIRSLEPVAARVWWKRPWPWAAVAALAVAAVVASVTLKPERRMEVARVETQPAPSLEAPTPAPAPRKAPPAPEPAGRREGRASSEAKRPSAGPVEPPIAAPAVAPRPAPLRSRMMLQSAGAASSSGSLAAPFGFRYTVDWSGDVAVTVEADGYLTILANQNDVLVPLYSLGPEKTGSTTHIPVPAGADALLIEFFRSRPEQLVPPSPFTQTTEETGEMLDPAPSPASKLILRIAK